MWEMITVIANRVERIIRPFKWIVLSSVLWYALNSLFFIFIFINNSISLVSSSFKFIRGKSLYSIVYEKYSI